MLYTHVAVYMCYTRGRVVTRWEAGRDCSGFTLACEFDRSSDREREKAGDFVTELRKLGLFTTGKDMVRGREMGPSIAKES